MSIKLIGLDLDGTVLTNQKLITSKTLDAISSALIQGIIVVPVTGRPFSGLPEEIIRIPGLRYVITTNGAATYDLKTNTRLEEHTLSAEVCADLFSFIGKDDVIREVFVNGYGYEDTVSYHALHSRLMGTPLQSYIECSRRPVPSMEQFLKECSDGVDGISLMFSTVDRLKQFARLLENRTDLCVTRPARLDLEINHPLANKGSALVSLGKRLGIPASETMAVGDSGNDTSLLRQAGFPVAMGNATEEIKSLSSFITRDNEHDGVAAAIRSFVLSA